MEDLHFEPDIERKECHKFMLWKQFSTKYRQKFSTTLTKRGVLCTGNCPFYIGVNCERKEKLAPAVYLILKSFSI